MTYTVNKLIKQTSFRTLCFWNFFFIIKFIIFSFNVKSFIMDHDDYVKSRCHLGLARLSCESYSMLSNLSTNIESYSELEIY